MDRAFVVCTSHRGPSDLTIESANRAGVRMHVSGGVSDTALARNIAFDRALETETEGHDVVIFCDDDMGFHREGLEALAAAARELGEAVSALYVLKDGRAACHMVHQGDDWRVSRWWTGLGLMAVPLAKLRALQQSSELVQVGGARNVHAFTWSGVEDGRWMSEDYRFCKRLGGVVLAPVAAGHSKTVPLWPDEQSLQAIRAGGASPKEKSNGQVPSVQAADL